MTILFAATELESFIASGAGTLPAVSTNNTLFDPNFSRSALALDGDSAAGPWRPIVLMGDIAECWAHYRVTTVAISLTNGNTIFELQNSAGQGVLRIQNVSTSQFRGEYWNGSAWTSMGANQSVADGTFTFDIHSLIANSGGLFEIYINGVLIWSLSGDTDLFSGSANDRVLFNRYTTGSAPDAKISEIILSTTSTLGQRVATLAPTGDGTYTAWTGTFADVDETSINDSDFISSITPNDQESFVLSDLSTTAQGYDPVAVTIASRGRIGATGPSNYQHLTRTGGNDFLSANLNPNTSFQAQPQTVYMQNPDTTADWTISDIQNLETGVKAIT